MSYIKRIITIKDWIEYSKCTTCWVEKELCVENFRINSNWRWYKWYRSQCRDCERKREREYIKEYNLKNPNYKKEYEATHKEWKQNYNRKYQQDNKEHIKEIKRIWNNNNRDKIYEQSKLRNNSYEYKEKQKQRRYLYDIDKMKRRIQQKTSDFIRKKNIRPLVCPICWSERRVISHHIDYNYWNLIIWCCDRCHRLIHSWYLNCPEPINLLEYKNR